MSNALDSSLLEVIVIVILVGIGIFVFGVFSRKSQIPTSANRLSTANRASADIEPASIEAKIRVHLEPEGRQIKAATETVNVPIGVTVTVKRSRQVEHTLNVVWSNALAGNIEAGLKGIVSASILSKIEQMQGHSYKQAEAVEYEIHLNGEKSNQYRLTWVDTMLTGTVEVPQGGTSQEIPFEFRAGTELEVTPMQ
jgi:hypothetical protein